MPISNEEKEAAAKKIKGIDSCTIERYLTKLREKCGSKFHMNKKAKQLAVK